MVKRTRLFSCSFCAALLSLAALAFYGCGGDHEQNTATDGTGQISGGKDRIAVVISTLDNPWFVVLRDAAVARAEELGYETTDFDSRNDTARETEHFENIVAAGFSAILFNPTDADASISNVLRAKKAGIPTFCMDRELNSKDAAASQILSDNFSGCVEIGKYFVKKMNKKGRYAELLGLPGDNNTWNRSKGFHSVVNKDNYPDLKLVAQQGADFDRTKAMDVMTTILQRNPDIKAVFCGNDAMAMGAYQALVSAGKAPDVMVFGFDGAADVINAIKEKKIIATGMQFPRKMAQKAAESADEYIRGKRDFDRKIPVAVELVTQENIDRYTAYGKK